MILLSSIGRFWCASNVKIVFLKPSCFIQVPTVSEREHEEGRRIRGRGRMRELTVTDYYVTPG